MVQLLRIKFNLIILLRFQKKLIPIFESSYLLVKELLQPTLWLRLKKINIRRNAEINIFMGKMMLKILNHQHFAESVQNFR